MKKFLQLLNEFFNWRDYKRRADSENNRLRWELKYVQDLLIEEAVNHDITHEKQAEINLYVAYLKHCRKMESSMKKLSDR